MFWLSLLGATAAAAPSLGVGVDAVFDLPDPTYGSAHASYGVGTALRVPVRVALGETVWLRATGSALVAGGNDRVEWTEDSGTSLVYSDSHWSLLTAAGLAVGPEIGIPAGDTVLPYFGADVGGQLVHNWHSFGGATAVLLDPATNDLADPNNIDPHTAALVPSLGVHGGVQLRGLAPFAIDLEAGYTVSFVRETALKNALPELDAVRVAYGLNALRFGVAASFDL